MNIMVVETNWWDRKRLVRFLEKAMPDMNICAFEKTTEALKFAKKNQVGAAFIDIGQSIHVPGLFLAEGILKLQKTNIVFTNYEWGYLQEAFELRASGYLRKPLQYKPVLKELQNLRYPLAEVGENTKPSQHKVRCNLRERILNRGPRKSADFWGRGEAP